MIQRILTALVLIPLVLLLILRAPIPVLAIVAGIVALLAIREFLGLVRNYGIEPLSVTTYIFTGIFFCLLTATTEVTRPREYAFQLVALCIGVFAGLAPFVFLALGLGRENLSSIYAAASASLFAFSYIALPMALLVLMRRGPGEFYVIFLMLVVWSGDIFAYFVGKSLGRHKMAPRLSPKKTWEGTAASVVASVIFGTSFNHFAAPIYSWLFRLDLFPVNTVQWTYYKTALWQVIGLSVVVNIAAQLGDLVESAIKRGANVKDSGAILPGHGGMLDRIDAMLFAVPVLWLWLLGTWLLETRFS